MTRGRQVACPLGNGAKIGRAQRKIGSNGKRREDLKRRFI
jgi:hypothetical protein